jgi:hypothetical protein
LVTVTSETTPSRRAEIRYSREAIPEITGLRVLPGDAATMVNISASGLLMESPTRYAPGRTLTVNFEGTIATKQIKARIVRCQVSAIDDEGKLQYYTALTFEGRLTLPVKAGAAPYSTAAEAKLGALSGAETTSPAEDAATEALQTANRW